MTISPPPFSLSMAPVNRGCESRGRRRPREAGFTLTELLVVVVLIGILVSLTVPTVAAVRALARRTACLGNLHEIGVATQNCRTFRDRYPQGYEVRKDGQIVRWMDALHPYLRKRSEVYACPSDPQKIVCDWDPDIVLSYGINTFNFKSNQYCFWYRVNNSDVRYPSRVILFADCTPGKYYCGGGRTFSDPVSNVDYRHLGDTFNALFCDGHAEARTRTTQEDWDASVK